MVAEGAVRVVRLSECGDRRTALGGIETSWPGFMYQDPCSWALSTVVLRQPEYTVLAFDGNSLVAYAHCAPVVWTDPLEELPSQGWDQMVGRAVRATVGDRDSEISIVCAFEISVAVSRQGQGLSSLMLDAMRDTAQDHGFDDLVAPVRPSAKHLEPRTPMEEYVQRVRADGLPTDPWLRVHVRCGGRIIGVCPASMSIAATLSEWRRWTGQAFDTEGELEVQGALVPVRVDISRNIGVYTEPNVWVHHRLR